MLVSPGGTHAETATLRTADGVLCHGVPAVFGRNTGRVARLRVVRADPDLADAPLRNGADVRGALVLVTRGAVPFVEKARRVAAAGAAGIVIVNNVNEPYVAHGHQYPDGRVDDGDGITIPVVCVRLGDGSALARRIPCRVSLDFCAPELPSSSHGSSETAPELHTPPPLPRQASVTSVAICDGARGPVGGASVSNVAANAAAAAATESARPLGADTGRVGAEQAKFTSDALHSPAVPSLPTQSHDASNGTDDRNRDTAAERPGASEMIIEPSSASARKYSDFISLGAAAPLSPPVALGSPVSPMSPMSPKQLAARAAAADARAAKQVAQALTETSAHAMRWAQQKEQLRQHRHQAVPETQTHLMCRVAPAGGRTCFTSQARTSSEESFLAHER